MRNFPGLVSLTVTNRCNLRCRMCGQWSDEGYMHGRAPAALAVDVWKRIVDESACHAGTSILIRGGEPFLYPGIFELIRHIKEKGLYLSIDSNGTLIGKYASEIAGLGIDHITVSIDGPEKIHDEVRRVKGCFRSIREGIARLQSLDQCAENRTGLGITFTISGDSYRGLGQMPDVARDLGVSIVTIVPYYYVSEDVGKQHEIVMRETLGCLANSWRGFHREASGVDIDEFRGQLRAFENSLGAVYAYPYMTLSEEQYCAWFEDCTTPVLPSRCNNVHGLLDVQPDGSVNFCVDFPDYVIGKVQEASLEALWNSERARRFRELRDVGELPVCLRCGARFMARE